MLRQYELIDKVRSYDPTADEALLNRAYVYAMRMHGSQKRASGDPYFAHPIEVAGILTDYRLDTATIVTALLHDVIEDCPVSRADIDQLFGEEIGELVEGVTKLSQLEGNSEHTRQAENLRKFILAISKDVRVLMVKLADRLHNMRTLEFIKNPAKRERIARETLDIYAPLARSIGCHRICTELEELAFIHLNPVARDAIGRRLSALRQEQGGAVSVVSDEVLGKLAEGGVPARVFGREKHPFSIWRKLQRKSIGFSQLSDIYAFRVIVDSEEDCYRALGVIHRAWSSVPERFKDYISTPKRNNYRSIHTTVVGPRGMRIEMQIRTEAMDRVAEDGVAAHWRYKNESYGFDAEAQAAAGGRDPLVNLRHLVQLLEHGGDVDELVEHAKLEMFLDQVFVFTPKGRLVSLPRGAMPLDFAYAVHTDVGDTCIGVKVNGELRPLRTLLQNGDVVEVIRGAKPVVPPDWRSLTVTGRARSAIRRHIRQSEKDEFTRLGRATVEQTFERAGKRLADVSLRPALDRFATAAEDDLYEAVGRGRVTPTQVLDVVFPGLNAHDREAATAQRRIEGGAGARLYVRGSGLTQGLTLHFAPCCSPVPGDRIVGILDPEGAGLAVHTIDCATLAEYEDREEVWRDLQWTPEAERNTISRASLAATIKNAPGMLGQVCTVIGEAGGNIVNLRMHHRQRDFFDVDFDLEVKDAKHLTHIAAALRANPSVETVDRAKG
ncbi:bifunctional (p)ppGpp synthetase/guanosine-3',5'-bis(diphosphate) 3'-pyrophosphohydrolase [Phenylobacterium sp.]|jgi:GTP pyrophosphokinase/guanosine-3',5'-bis(diphosphate) 3'-pyrophosphohydrolase|uniref:RelA/SpoT family protein n=1 Tax=Phenylobacterium sp. TaxID=1871053 RepID=UPI000C8C37BE|nr:bifunctional (p)ppGpp synthetase/guanosine-3',5'-bis(diphosphate) 3'-pyrophosphohydrolase [Phenylobacterium sp.]MAK80843.1 bifunctional (p)ppGpp synthetase/guanosine-3',5'-bis(diphosphate) 3'-pyrophosphohydrolase [Phenylobacterium sp.]|tara:strand:+ start:37787 stop:39955 length:2169 start_codon:yes stop_codon:yes gene_type:complete